LENRPAGGYHFGPTQSIGGATATCATTVCGKPKHTTCTASGASHGPRQERLLCRVMSESSLQPVLRDGAGRLQRS